MSKRDKWIMVDPLAAPCGPAGAPNALVKRVNSRIEICEADKYDQERGNMWVLRFPSDQGAWLSRALSVEDMQQLRAALDDSRFLPGGVK